MSIKVWLRAVRARFLMASVIAVAAGLAASWSRGDTPELASAGLTLAGVLALHASVDLLNDYWDHKRGIDANTTPTPFSGGTGVIREGLIPANKVRQAGIASMLIGAGIGGYFVLTHGPIIALILGFAIVSIYFYSTRIVDGGMAEVFVASKGALITIGASFIQSGEITIVAIASGVCVGILSATVLYVTSFPDHDADKRGGRRTLVVILGPKRGAKVFWVFPCAFGIFTICAIYAQAIPITCAFALAVIPLAFYAGRIVQRKYQDIAGLVPAMKGVVLYSRISGALVVAGLIVWPLLNTAYT